MARRMKDSGVEWIGKIPCDWKLIKGRYCYKVQSGFPFASDNFSVTKGFPLIRIRDITSGSIETFYDGEYSEDYVVRQDDFLIGMDGDFNVRMWSERPALLNQRCCRVLEFDGYSRKYLFYVLPFYLNIVNQLAYSTTVKHLSVPDLNEADVPSPSLSEQQRIAKFLDRKCSAIDDVLAKTQESIEEYKKLKQAVITEAVTKGVRGKRPMKDSGIDWIGQIPKEWSCRKIKSYTNLITKGATPKDISIEKNEMYPIRFLKSENIVNNNLEHYPEFYISESIHNGELKRSSLKSNDMLFVIAGASLGKVAIMDSSLVPANTNQAMAFMRFDEQYINVEKYVWYVLQSDIAKTYISLFAVQSAQPNISMENLGNMRIPSPFDNTETVEIASYLDKKCAAIDTLISKKQQFIEELTAYKKSLIYEYVTGKKEVPA